MAAPYNPPVKNEDFMARIALADAANPAAFKATATISSGDFALTKDNGAYTYLDVTSTGNSHIVPDSAGGVLLKVYLTAADMNGDNVTLVGRDSTSPKEWADFVLALITTA